MKAGSRKAVVRQEGGTQAASLAPAPDAPGIFSVQLYDPACCDTILREIKKARPWHAARVSLEDGNPDGVVLPATRSASILGWRTKPALFTQYERKVRSTVSPLVRQLWGVNLVGCDGTQLIRYQPGGLYAPHKDSSEEPGEISFSSRYFTVLCYLNSDFKGGKTDFPGLGYAASPQTGKALIFPSDYMHAAQPVHAGEKFVLITWLCGPVPLRWI